MFYCLIDYNSWPVDDVVTQKYLVYGAFNGAKMLNIRKYCNTFYSLASRIFKKAVNAFLKY